MMDCEYSNEETKSNGSSERRSSSVSSSRDALTSDKDSFHYTNKEDEMYDDNGGIKTLGDKGFMTSYYAWMKRIAMAQILIAIVCIVISIPLLIEAHRSSVGSGLWCSVFFAVVGGLNFTAKRMDRGFIALVTFGATCMYFGLIMVVIESIELATVLMDRSGNSVAFILHAILDLLAVLEILLAVTALVLCCKKKKRDAPFCNSRNKNSVPEKLIVPVLVEN